MFVSLMVFFLLMGCAIDNTPVAQVEDLLGSYQRVDDNISIDPYMLTYSDSLDSDIEERYKKVIRKQYQNMSYEIKDDSVDGDTAVVKVEVKALDFKSIIEKYNYSDYSNSEYDKILVEGLEEVKEKVVYTIDFTLSKNSSGEWQVDDLTTDMNHKLLGIY